MNRLCRLTPEGYMILIDQRQFEGREAQVTFAENPDQQEDDKDETGATTMCDSFLDRDLAKKYGLAKDVEKIFSKICESIELYKTENIPIITEFLEF